MGATHTVNSSESDPVTAIQELTDGNGADVVIDAVSRPETWKRAFYARDLVSTVVLVGVPTPDMQIPEIPLIDVFGRGGSLKSSWYGDCLPSRDFHDARRPLPAGAARPRRLRDRRDRDRRRESAFEEMHAGDVLRSVVIL